MNKIPNQSSWEEETKAGGFPSLDSDLKTEIVIVGGGLTGILSAYFLAQSGHKVVLLEKEKELISDTTLYTTAHITQIIDTPLSELIKIFGERKAKLVWQAGAEAIEAFEQIISKENIDCEFKRCASFTYVNDADDYDSLIKESQITSGLGFESSVANDKLIGFLNAGFWKVPNQAKFHPIKFGNAIVSKLKDLGVQIFTKTEVKDFKEDNEKIQVSIKKNTITADKIIVATYKPIKLLKTFAKKGTYKSYVFEVEIAKDLIKDGLYQDTNNPYHYFRIDNMEKNARMIIGGEDHRMELKVPESKNFKALEEYLKSILQDHLYEIKRKWAGPILEPSDGLALIGESNPNQFVATAFSGNGMTYAMIAARMFTDIINKNNNPYIEVFDPKRIPSIKQLAYKGRDYTGEFLGAAAKNIFK